MNSIPSFNSYIEQSIKRNWEQDSLTDYQGETYQFHDVARKIEKLHIVYANIGLQKGDKIAVCGRNSSNWGVAFLATLTYGAVVVPIQHEFTPDQIQNIVNHSEAKILFADESVSASLNAEKMPNLIGIIHISDFSVPMSHSEQLDETREHLNELFGNKYPKFFRKEHVSYFHDEPDDLALINYTSGTTGFSKGVMLSYRSMWSNLDFTMKALGSGQIKQGSNVLSILPMSHMYGLMIEFIFEFCFGNHIFFLTRLPSPSLILTAMSEIKPAIIISVPLIVEKIIRKTILPLTDKNVVKLLSKMPGIGKKIKAKFREEAMNIFGGNLYEIIIGGASLNKEIEQFFMDIEFPLTVGYGTTETGPMISYSDYHQFKPGSCGTCVIHMETKVLSNHPETEPGEIVVRGLNVMNGYYKNPEATQAVIDSDGWFHTGDLGTIDASGNIFIRGRIKNMLLGANGQNVYPEEIEDKLNTMTMVSESLIIQSGDKLVGLVYPDMEEARSMGFTNEDLMNIMEQNRISLNAKLPNFCKLAEIKLQPKEFEKTPKRNIKRYLYQTI